MPDLLQGHPHLVVLGLVVAYVHFLDTRHHCTYFAISYFHLGLCKLNSINWSVLIDK